jgi:hypothetical protein
VALSATTPGHGYVSIFNENMTKINTAHPRHRQDYVPENPCRQ